LERVIKMLGNADATTAKYEGMGHRAVDVLELEPGPRSLRVRTPRVVGVDLPGFAKKVLKPTNTMLQLDEWQAQGDGTWTGTFSVDVQGSPVHLHGTMRLAPAGETCTEDITVDVTVKVPLVGGKIADWAARNDVDRSLRMEFELNDRWLADHPV
jgi:hypothetical protein